MDQISRAPKTLYVDQGVEFRGTFKQRVTREGTIYEASSLESPYQRGVTERHGKTFKAVLAKAMREHPCSSYAGIDSWTRP